MNSGGSCRGSQSGVRTHRGCQRAPQGAGRRSIAALLACALMAVLLVPSAGLCQASRVSCTLYGGGGLLTPDDVSDLVDAWIGDQPDVVNLAGDTRHWFSVPFGVSFSIKAASWLDVRPEFGMEWIPLYLLSSGEDGDLRSTIWTYSPGISLLAASGAFRFGLGIQRCYAEVHWTDEVSDFSEVWRGNDFAYSVTIGFEKRFRRHFGWSSVVTYRWLLVDPVRTPHGERLWNRAEERNFRLDLSGFSLRGGPTVIF